MQVIEAPRSEHLHASDLARIAGFDGKRTGADVYAEKVEGITQFDQDDLPEEVEWGILHEQNIADQWARKNGIDPERLYKCPTYQHPKHSVIAGTPDRGMGVGAPELVLECKSTDAFNAKDWGEEGTNDFPEKYICQVATYRSIIGVDEVNVAVLIGGNKHRQYVYVKDEEFEGQLFDIGLKFWRDHIVTKTPPPIDGSDASSAMLRKWFPKAGKEIRVANETELPLLDTYSELYQTHKSLGEKLDVQKNIIKQIIGDDKGIEWDGGKVTYNNVAGRVSTNLNAVIEELRTHIKDDELIDKIIESHTKRGKGYRRLLPRFAKEGE